MKIHIVQKGDTLWKLAEKYGVGFDQLKAANTQLANPDMIMPGMKIKIPTGSVPVKKEAKIKEQPKKEVQIAPQPKAEPKMEMPMMPQQMMHPTKKQIDINTYQTNVNFYQPQVKPKPKMPTVQKPPVSKKVEPKKEMVKPKEQIKPIKKEMYKPKHYAPKQPLPQMQPIMQQPMCPPEYIKPVSPLMPGCGPTPKSCGPMNQQPYQQPVQPQYQPYQQPMQSQHQPYQQPIPFFPNQQQMPMPQQSYQPGQTQMPYYPQQQIMPQQQGFAPTQEPMPYYPQNHLPMQQAMPHRPNLSGYSKDCCGPSQPITYGLNGQMMPVQDPYFGQGYHESDDYDD